MYMYVNVQLYIHVHCKVLNQQPFWRVAKSTLEPGICIAQCGVVVQQDDLYQFRWAYGKGRQSSTHQQSLTSGSSLQTSSSGGQAQSTLSGSLGSVWRKKKPISSCLQMQDPSQQTPWPVERARQCTILSFVYTYTLLTHHSTASGGFHPWGKYLSAYYSHKVHQSSKSNLGHTYMYIVYCIFFRRNSVLHLWLTILRCRCILHTQNHRWNCTWHQDLVSSTIHIKKTQKLRNYMTLDKVTLSYMHIYTISYMYCIAGNIKAEPQTLRITCTCTCRILRYMCLPEWAGSGMVTP